MKRFRFRLQRILDIREQFRDEARQELVRRQLELVEQESILKGLEDDLLGLRLKQDGILTAGELQVTGAYAARLRQLIEQQVVKVEQAKSEVVKAREQYVQANRDAKALEMLKDKKKEEYNCDLLKEEVNQLDEVAIQRAGARK